MSNRERLRALLHRSVRQWTDVSAIPEDVPYKLIWHNGKIVYQELTVGETYKAMQAKVLGIEVQE